jgi:hypothetical protein
MLLPASHNLRLLVSIASTAQGFAGPETTMPITNDDQIDYERVVADPEYRRQVIVYLNAQERRTDRRRPASLPGNAIGFPGPHWLERPANQRLRRFG